MLYGLARIFHTFWTKPIWKLAKVKEMITLNQKNLVCLKQSVWTQTQERIYCVEVRAQPWGPLSNPVINRCNLGAYQPRVVALCNSTDYSRLHFYRIFFIMLQNMSICHVWVWTKPTIFINFHEYLSLHFIIYNAFTE